MESIGLCPICHKGQIVKGSIGYACNYFKSMYDKCSFNIYHTYFSKVITDDIVKDLLEKGETEVFTDLQKKDGTPFSASLKIQDGVIKPIFANEKLKTPCPVCGGNVEVMLSGYACENYHKKACKLFIPNKICDRQIPQEAVEMLLNGEKTPFMNGFKRNDGDEFESRLYLTSELNVAFSNSVSTCPKCGGEIYSGKKAYNCSNYKNENVKCDFVVWKEISGRNIGIEEVVALCQNKETEVLSGFKDKEGNLIDRKLIVNNDFKVKLV